MGKGLHLCHIYIALDVDALGLLGKYHGHVKISCSDAGDAYA